MTGKKSKCKDGSKEEDIRDDLDKTICKQMASLVELLTTSGKPILNPEIMKKFKKLCRTSDGYVEYAYSLLMKQLSKNHAEIRLSTFQMIDEIFNRSHAFRVLLLADFQHYLELAIGVKNHGLPKPTATAGILKSEALRAMETWNDKFGEAYKQLALGYDFLQTCEKINFTNIRQQQEEERRKKEEAERRKTERKQEKLEETLQKFDECNDDIDLCLTEINNGLELLMPHPEDFFIPTLSPSRDITQSHNSTQSKDNLSKYTYNHTDNTDGCSKHLENEDNLNQVSNNLFDNSTSSHSVSEKSSGKSTQKSMRDSCIESENDTLACLHSEECVNQSKTENECMDRDEEEEEECVEMSSRQLLSREVGMFSGQFEITVNVGASNQKFQETDDNRDVVRSVRDQYRLVKSKFLPRIKHYIQVLEKSGASSKQQGDVLKVCEKLEDVMKKCLELEVVTDDMDKNRDSDSDDEFEEVPEKEGYEDDVPEHVKLQAASSSSSKSGSGRKSKGSRKTKATSSKGKSKLSDILLKKQQDKMCNRTIKEEPGCSTSYTVTDPGQVTVKQEPVDSDSCQYPVALETKQTSKGQSEEERKQCLLERAPVVSFGLDIKHWENMEQLKAPVKVSYADASRFWVPSKDGEEGDVGSQEEVAALTRRTITYVGEFEPVKWKCRAPLGDGRLCERMDRVKCPFHGKIIGRDATGTPTGTEELIKLAHQDLGTSQGSDSDQSEEEPTSSSNAVKSKGKGKGKRKAKKRKYPNLTDIREVETSRDRLEAKIFNRSTLKRVCSSLDALDQKKVSARFANQFNYSLK